MASFTFYGSSVADGVVTSACDMASVTGGTETSKTTTFGATSNTFGEFFSQGGSTTGAVSIPATPTGNGWVAIPGSGTFATGNWSASITMSLSGAQGANSNTTIRFFRRSSG